jgi:hypothetical protein
VRSPHALAFNDADRAGAQLVVMMNRKLAEHFWPNQSPIGKRMRIGTPQMQTPWLTIVGEVADVKLRFSGRADERSVLLSGGPAGRGDWLAGAAWRPEWQWRVRTNGGTRGRAHSSSDELEDRC